MTMPRTQTSIKTWLADEWHRRTWYGKLWFPVWVLVRVTVALAAFTLALVVLFVHSPEAIIKSALSPLTTVLRRAVGRLRALFPNVYHE